MSFIYDLSDTWNNAGISWNGIKLNVTDTASAVTSKLVDLQIGGVSKFSVSKTGAVTAAGNIQSTSGGFTFPDGTTQITRAVTSVTATDGSIAITGTTNINLSAVFAPKSYAAITTVRNNSGATLTKGTAVYINGAIGQNPTVTKAIATSDATSAQTLGLVADDILNNANGEIILIGTLYNVNTSAYTDGQQLYLSPTTAGGLTATKPYAPNHLVYMAVVEHAHPTQGKLFVKVQNGYEMDELHDVSARNPINGQTLVYNSTTTLWEKNTVSLTAGVNGVLPVANGGTNATTAADALTNLGAYPASNPSGYITSSALSPYLTSATAATTYQPLDGDLTAIAALAGTTGIVRKTAANTYTLDTASYLTGITSGQVTTALGFTPYNATNPAGYTSNVGTVTSVGITAGTGVSVSGGPITSSGAITVTNTAPDQIVSITGAGTATVTGTYPNFTITATGGSGTVSSVAASGGTTGLTFTGSPITTSGTLTLGGTLATASGGTNLTSYTAGDLVYASALNTLGKLGIGTSGYVLTSNGSVPSWGLVNLSNGVTGTLPVSKGGTGNASWTIGSLMTFSSTTNATEVAPGTSGYALTSNGVGTLPTYSQINIVNATTGTLTTARGGTNLTSFTSGGAVYATSTSVLTTGTLPIASGGTSATTKAAAFNALSPVTSTGDLIIGNGANSNTRLAIGANGYVLTSNGTTASWQAAGGGGGGVTSFNSRTGAVTLTSTDVTNALGYTPSSLSSPVQTYQGGTGNTSTPMNGQLLIGNGGGYSVANLTAGANVTITNSFGGITIAASGGGGGGPTINTLSIGVSGYSPFQPNAPTSNYSKPLVGIGGMPPSNYGAFAFKNMSGGYNINGGVSIDSIGILDSAATYVLYMSGSDFSGYPGNFRVDDSILSCYGMQIYNAAMFTLFSDTANAMTSPNLAPSDAMSAYSSNNPDIQVSTDMGTFFKTGGGGIVVDKNMTNYVVYFGTGNPSYTSGMTVNSIQLKAGGAGLFPTTYYSGSDFYVSYSENTSMGMFQMMMTVYNPTLQTLLDNSFRA